MLDGGSNRYSSGTGGICSLIMYIFILSYSGIKIAGMAQGANSLTIVKEYDVFLENDEHLIPKIAFGISSFPPN